VTDAVSPSGSSTSEVRVVVEYPLIDVAEYQLTFLGAEDRHGDNADVAVIGFGFVVCGRATSRREQVPVTCNAHTFITYRVTQKTGQVGIVNKNGNRFFTRYNCVVCTKVYTDFYYNDNISFDTHNVLYQDLSYIGPTCA